MANIKTFEAACKALGLNPKTVPDFSHAPKQHQAALIAHYKLVIIAEALNEGWKPTWKNDEEYKYYPWFEMESSKGFRFCVARYYYSVSDVGSRLCFRSRELAEYAGKTFLKLYKDYMIL